MTGDPLTFFFKPHYEIDVCGFFSLKCQNQLGWMEMRPHTHMISAAPLALRINATCTLNMFNTLSLTKLNTINTC